jgi:outer membrane protein assembly factor BamB
MLNTKTIRTSILFALCVAISSSSGAQEHWPEFRGPLGNGIAPEASDPPTEWDETKNITWKTAIPLKGWSSPAIVDDQIWLTTATEDGKDYYVVRVNATTGEIDLNEHLFHTDNPEPLGNNVNRYASPSSVLEEDRVYVHFGTYGTACLNTKSGKVLWKRDDLNCRHYRGPGSSPILFEDLLILSYDGVDQQYLTALNKMTGKTVWHKDRGTVFDDLTEDGTPFMDGDRRKSFSTPVIVDVDGEPLMVSPSSFAVYAYNPRTGEEIWKVTHESHTAQIRPVYAEGLMYVTTGYSPTELLAIRVDGEGDVTDTHVEWRAQDVRLPTTPSSLLVDGLLYIGTDKGDVACLDASNGDIIWTERIGGSYVASPLYADGKLYFFSTQGKSTVMKAGRKPKILNENRLDDGCLASPGMLGSSLILRSKTHLYRIETNS